MEYPRILVLLDFGKTSYSEMKLLSNLRSTEAFQKSSIPNQTLIFQFLESLSLSILFCSQLLRHTAKESHYESLIQLAVFKKKEQKFSLLCEKSR